MQRQLATKGVLAFNHVIQELIGQFGGASMTPPLLNNGEDKDSADRKNKARRQAFHKGSLEEKFS